MEEENKNITSILNFINQTQSNIFLTGRAGTGKTTFLRSLSKSTYKNIVVVAPTGIAAINANGVTIHSFFQLPFGTFIPSNDDFYNLGMKITNRYTLIKELHIRAKKRQLIRNIDLLVIDEVSMLRADVLDAIDSVLRHIRRRPNLPFGGLQVLFIGDMYQLPPVVKDEEWHVLKNYYNSIYFFDSKVLTEHKPVYFEFEKIYRQNDPAFISMLNRIRDDEIEQKDIDLLNYLYRPNYEAPIDENIITITTHNRKADTINQNYLDKLNTKEFVYKAIVDGNFPDNMFPVDEKLCLKIGAQVMFIKNDYSGENLYFNGKIGIVEKLTDGEIFVKTDDFDEPFKVDKYQWENVRYELDAQKRELNEVVIGSFSHFPIKLAWAITVHKSQGLTFEKAVLDISDSFAHGQIYVAMSRLTSLQGLVLKSRIDFDTLLLDKKILEHSKTKPSPQVLDEMLHKDRFFYIANLVIESFNLYEINQEINLKTANFKDVDNELFGADFFEFFTEFTRRFREFLDVATRFQKQVFTYRQYFSQEALDKIIERCLAASEYFVPKLEDLSQFYRLQLIGLFKESPELELILDDVMELETALYEQTKSILIAERVCENVKNSANNTYADLYQREADVQRELERAKFFGKKISKSKTKKVKKQKVSTVEKTYLLYEEGKSMEEIAESRGLKVETISRHLAELIRKKIIEVEKLVSQEEIDLVTKSHGGGKYISAWDLYKKLDGAVSQAKLNLIVEHMKLSINED